jgi:LAS superfamily LD-carboxypeptidase LdcB
MRTVVSIAGALLLVVTAGVMIEAAEVSANPRKPVHVLDKKLFVPKSRVVHVRKGDAAAHSVSAMTDPSFINPEARVDATSVAPVTVSGTPILRSGVASPGCTAKKGMCDNPNTCKGTLFRGVCPGALVCCIPSTPAQPAAGGLSMFSKAYLTGKFNPATHPDFMVVATKYSSEAGRYIRKDVFQAYLTMAAAAKKEIGIDLTILSATRTFDAQKKIWEDKWTTNPQYKNINPPVERGRAILSYSSMPTTSQHHWGTSMDLVNLSPSYFTGTANGRKLDSWFKTNLKRFGFCRPFSPMPPRTAGYNEEQWHVSYVPLVKQLVPAYLSTVTYADINGFKGSEVASQLGAIEKYVGSIDSSCLA